LLHKLLPKHSNLIHNVAVDVNKENKTEIIQKIFNLIPNQHHHLLMEAKPEFHTFDQLISRDQDEAIIAIIDLADADALRAQFKPSKGQPMLHNTKKILGKNLTPLHHGIASAKFDLLGKMIMKLQEPKYPADLLPLFLSMREGYINLWWHLDRKHVPLLYDSYGRASFNLSSIKARQNFFRNLLTILPPEWLADLCRPNEFGDTPLHAAIRYQDGKTIAALLAHREDIPHLFQANLKGETPMDLIGMVAHKTIEVALQEKVIELGQKTSVVE
jgi:hypothetical protein